MTGRVYARDGLNAGYCRSGMRLKCGLLGVDFRTFVRDGVPLEQAEKIEDAQIARTVEFAKARISKELNDVD